MSGFRHDSNAKYPNRLTGVSGVSGYLTAATLTAAAALWQQEGRTTIMLPVMAALIVASYFAKFRIEQLPIRFICRLALYIAVLIAYRIRVPNSENTFIDPFVLNQIGELCVAEILIRAWSRYSAGKYNQAVVILPVGVVFVVATNTYNDNIGRYFTPVFMVLLALAMQRMRAAAMPEATRRARLGVGVAITTAALLGAALYHALFVNRDALTEWANRVLNGSSLPISATGLSDESHLASMFGRSGSYDRVLRVHTTADVSYMRAYSMYNYQGGFWNPPARDNNRKFEPVNEMELQSTEDGTQAQVYRYLSSIGFIFAPLNAVSISIDGTTHLRWAREEGGPLRFDIPGPDSYTMTIGAEGQQGLVCEPPGAVHLQQLLTLPRDINPRIVSLAKSITAGITDPLRKARAIEAYLPAHHGYSQHIRVNFKDPLSDFLFSDKAAHCEFFASAAVILMRCAGIPSRYVIGYFAHEEEDGDIVVRQRDAHAWAECWVKDAGWITIDATPASGRPNGDVGSIPAWKHTIEKMQDWFANMRQKFTPSNLLRAAGLFVCLTLVAYLLQNRYHFTLRRVRRIPVKEYTSSGADLRTLYVRFEAVCRKYNLNCPPSVPWQQHLRDEMQRLSLISGSERQGADTIGAAADFIAAYDLARFGRGLGPGEFAALNSKLDVIERDGKRVITEEKSI